MLTATDITIIREVARYRSRAICHILWQIHIEGFDNDPEFSSEYQEAWRQFELFRLLSKNPGGLFQIFPPEDIGLFISEFTKRKLDLDDIETTSLFGKLCYYRNYNYTISLN